MRDITTNNNKSQDDNQKTTPVTESFLELNNSSVYSPGSIFHTWLGMRDSNPRSWDQNPLPYHLANPQYIYSLLSISDSGCEVLVPMGLILFYSTYGLGQPLP